MGFQGGVAYDAAERVTRKPPGLFLETPWVSCAVMGEKKMFFRVFGGLVGMRSVLLEHMADGGIPSFEGVSGYRVRTMCISVVWEMTWEWDRDSSGVHVYDNGG